MSSPASSKLGLSVWFVSVVLAVACSSPTAERNELPAGPPTVEVTMDEYRFDYNPNIPPGRVLFRVTNAGELVHRLTMVPLPEELPPIDQQLRGSQRQFLTPFAGVPNRQPGTRTAFTVDLVPGVRYAMICFVVDPDGQSHASKGMSSEYRVAPAEAAPTPSTTVGG